MVAFISCWAHYELGRGGWWYWNPVENTALMPRLLRTALLRWYLRAAAQGNEWTKDQRKRLAQELETNRPPR